ncbi:MAG: protein-L-isoaspartate(D-aspartate) O-methyltransferase [Sedimentisphaerales bacterium]|nr:protein-L-isoaspartate(D-aspartate) O-methyltransferase [Sedimentisphaerales bacterium]
MMDSMQYLQDTESTRAKRLQMVEYQIRRRDIHDEKVLRIMEELPRHVFIPEANRSEAYMDQPVSIGLGQTISQPYIVALMTEKLAVEPEHTVLEIGTGCGYQTAILARLPAQKVYTIEVLEDLAQKARKILTHLGIDNVEFHTGDGRLGWPEDRQFDRILVAAASEDLPEKLLAQLKDGGKMVIPIGEPISQRLMLLTRQGDHINEELLCHCRFVRLVRT